MESFYGIGVKNRYEMFYDDDSDPVELLKKTQAKKKEKAAEKENKTKEKPKETTKKQEKTTNGNFTEKRQEINHKDAPRDKKDFKRTERVRFNDREERNNQRNSGEHTAKDTKDGSSNQRFNGEVRGRGRGRGGKSDDFSRGGRSSNSEEFSRGGKGSSSDEFRGARNSNSDDFSHGGKSSNADEFGRGRGNRRGRGNWSERGGKREFDRQSGMATSGIKPVDKKDGAGSFNWGSTKEQINMMEGNDQENETADSPDKAKEPGSEAKENEFPKEEEGPKEMTLDEWKALQKREIPQFNVRKAGEGENKAQWKKTYVLKKKDNEDAEEANLESAEADGHQGKRKVLLPIDFQFSDTPMRGRFRGRGRGGPGTGRGRGRGTRGGGRFTSRPEAPKMDDEKVFPSLG